MRDMPCGARHRCISGQTDGRRQISRHTGLLPETWQCRIGNVRRLPCKQTV